ncbi:MAG: Lrp/AsnC family transcriptional regulator [Euryarchaeota archaeon]|nr:Lrp/AsnC family transcriptional regulator [Euryarchaeota archaeon]
MPKTGKISIEADERKVVDQLLKDSRQSPHEIAKRLGFSRQKVWRIIKKLEKNNVIWGYSATIDQNILDMNIYFALIKSKSSFYNLDELIDKIKEKSAEKLNIKFKDIYYLNGAYDSLIIFNAKDVLGAKKYCMFIQNEYGQFIERIDMMENIFPVMRDGTVNPGIEKLKDLICI